MSGRHQLTRFDQLAQHDAVAGRDDRGVAEVELSAAQPSLRDRGLRLQVLQLLKADDLIGIEPFTALAIALRLLRQLPRLLDLRADFGKLDFREALALAHPLAFLHRDAAHDTAYFERQAHLVARGDDPVADNGLLCRTVGGHRDADRGWLVDDRGRAAATACKQGHGAEQSERDRQSQSKCWWFHFHL